MALFRSSFRALALVGAGLVFALPVWAQSRMAVVDTQRAIMETEEGLRMQATLKKLFDSKQRELDKKQEELVKEREDIEKQRDVLSKGADAGGAPINVRRASAARMPRSHFGGCSPDGPGPLRGTVFPARDRHRVRVGSRARQ